MHTSAVMARWDCLTQTLYHSGLRPRPDCERGTSPATWGVGGAPPFG